MLERIYVCCIYVSYIISHDCFDRNFTNLNYLKKILYLKLYNYNKKFKAYSKTKNVKWLIK